MKLCQLPEPALFAVAFAAPHRSLRNVFYTGRAGAAAFSVNRAEAFYAYSVEGAVRKAEELAKNCSAVAGYEPAIIPHPATEQSEE